MPNLKHRFPKTSIEVQAENVRCISGHVMRRENGIFIHGNHLKPAVLQHRC